MQRILLYVLERMTKQHTMPKILDMHCKSWRRRQAHSVKYSGQKSVTKPALLSAVFLVFLLMLRTAKEAAHKSIYFCSSDIKAKHLRFCKLKKKL